MSKYARMLACGLVLTFTATAWSQFPYAQPQYSNPYGAAAISPYLHPYFGPYQYWQVRAHPLTGAIESQSITIDPMTGAPLLHRRVIPRHGMYAPPTVLDQTLDPTTGTVRSNTFGTDPITGALRTTSRTYNPVTGAYDQQEAIYHPHRGRGQTVREHYDPATRRTQTEVIEYDPRTGDYYRRGGNEPSNPQPTPQTAPGQNAPSQAATDQPGNSQRQVKVYEWPPQDPQSDTPAAPKPPQDNNP